MVPFLEHDFDTKNRHFLIFLFLLLVPTLKIEFWRHASESGIKVFCNSCARVNKTRHPNDHVSTLFKSLNTFLYVARLRTQTNNLVSSHKKTLKAQFPKHQCESNYKAKKTPRNYGLSNIF